MATKLEDNQIFTTIDLQTTFHRPVLPEEVKVVATVERMGRKVAYVVAELVQNDKKVCNAVSSVMILKKHEIIFSKVVWQRTGWSSVIWPPRAIIATILNKLREE